MVVEAEGCPDAQQAGLKAEQGAVCKPSNERGCQASTPIHRSQGILQNHLISAMCGHMSTGCDCEMLPACLAGSGAAEPGLSMAHWELGGFQGLWMSVAELRDGAQTMGETAALVSSRKHLEYEYFTWRCQCHCGRYGSAGVLVCAGVLTAPTLLAMHTETCSPGSKTVFPASLMFARTSD